MVWTITTAVVAALLARNSQGMAVLILPLLTLLAFAAYLGWSLSRLARASATLPMRLFGYRFLRARDGASARFLRIWLAWWVPGAILLFAPPIAALLWAKSLPAGLLIASAGPMFHLADLASARGVSRRTLRDRLAGLVMVKP